MKHLKKFNEADESEFEESGKTSSYSMVETPGLYEVIHQKYATDRFAWGTTIVSANSKEEAMNKLNDYLSTYPDGGYTSLPCRNVNEINLLTVLK